MKRPGKQDTARLLLGRAQAELALGERATAKADLLLARNAQATVTASAQQIVRNVSEAIENLLAKLSP
jgi:hypothetical protein